LKNDRDVPNSNVPTEGKLTTDNWKQTYSYNNRNQTNESF